MVIPVSNIFKRVEGVAGRPHRPVLNEVPVVSAPTPTRFGGFNTLYQRFWKWYKRSPELVAVINLITTDIIGDRPSFVGTDGMPLGRNKNIQSTKFWREQRIKETLKGILFDLFVTGDAYGFMGFLDSVKRAEAVKELSLAVGFQGGLSVKEQILLRKAMDEDLRKPKTFDYVASSTMQINVDNFDVQGYTQFANGINQHFTTEEIIHFRLQTMDGKVHGFSPVEALGKELALLWFVKGNMVSFMENGGSPGKLFILEEAEPGQPAFDRFQEQLQSMKDVRNRHGNWLGSGKMSVEDLDLNPKDMEYKDLALYVTSCLAFAFNIPVTRIPFLIGGASSSGDSGGMAESGYWNMISEKQDMIEDLMNMQLFEKLGFHIQLPRKYKQDEVREAQTYSQNSDTVQKIQTILRNQKMKLSDEKIRDLLNLRPDDIEEMTEEELMGDMERTGLMNQNMLDNQSMNKEPDNRKRADTKRNVANTPGAKAASV